MAEVIFGSPARMNNFDAIASKSRAAIALRDWPQAVMSTPYTTRLRKRAAMAGPSFAD